jgi:hypothetical protein
MWTKRLFGMAGALVSGAVAAHPGHPALGPHHTHAFFGIDPLYALLLLLAFGIVAIAVRRRRVRAINRSRR